MPWKKLYIDQYPSHACMQDSWTNDNFDDNKRLMEDKNLQRISDFAYVRCDLATSKNFQGQMDIYTKCSYIFTAK